MTDITVKLLEKSGDDYAQEPQTATERMSDTLERIEEDREPLN